MHFNTQLYDNRMVEGWGGIKTNNKFISDQHFFQTTQNIFWTKNIFQTKDLFGPKSFVIQTKKNFGPKFFFGPNIFSVQKILWNQTFLDLNFFLRRKVS